MVSEQRERKGSQRESPKCSWTLEFEQWLKNGTCFFEKSGIVDKSTCTSSVTRPQKRVGEKDQTSTRTVPFTAWRWLAATLPTTGDTDRKDHLEESLETWDDLPGVITTWSVFSKKNYYLERRTVFSRKRTPATSVQAPEGGYRLLCSEFCGVQPISGPVWFLPKNFKKHFDC